MCPYFRVSTIAGLTVARNVGGPKVDEFGLFLKRQNKNHHSCLIARGMGPRGKPIRQNFNPIIRQLFGAPTFLAIRHNYNHVCMYYFRQINFNNIFAVIYSTQT